jgi:hypothetical protein
MNLMFKLMAVSKSGYHEWLYRGISSREQANNKLTKQIRSVHQESRKIYGGLCITPQIERRFRLKSNTDFTLTRTPISLQIEH